MLEHGFSAFTSGPLHVPKWECIPAAPLFPAMQQTLRPMPTALITAVELLLGFNRAQLRPPTPNRDPLRLVKVLQACGFPLSPALEQVAVLHGTLDTIEDPAKLQRALAAIRRVCGEDVASMVRSLAKDPAHKNYPPDVAEQRYLARLSCHALRHPEILLVKLGEVAISQKNPNASVIAFFARNYPTVPFPESRMYACLLVQIMNSSRN